MKNKSHLIVVESEVLPEVIIKVLEVKKLLANKEEKSSAAACKRVGVSRSAYYKYRNSVYSYEEKLMQKIITLYMLLRDEPVGLQPS
ncbi:aconitase [Porcipelethomonas sp.]|uniref:aconitase n=1 Tax=Porcipelethomonas sp. TaxID=2981675 RepID=UPI0030790E1D